MKRIMKPGVSRRGFLAGMGAVAAGVSFIPRQGFSAEEKKLNFYNWDTYIGETTLADFEKASGIEVKMDLFADNDELFAKLKEGNPGYDLIVPTNDYVERMIVANMLVPIDHSKIPNISNIDPVFRDAAFDPGRKFSLPYMWGTIGIGYRKSKVKSVPDSWKWLYDSDQYSGRIALLADGGAVIQMGLKYMGYPLNSTDPALIKKVEVMLIKQKPHIKVFAEDNGQDLLASGEVDLTMEWNGDILQVMDEDEDIAYVVPKEGGLLWQDCLCIPKGAPHPNNAHALINFILDADAGAEIADFIQYATPNKAAKAKLPPEYRDNPAIFPPDEVTRKSEASIYKGEDYQRLIDETWTRIQAA
ncbi:MAG: spermidine/putrescine ABC transporter substrate-binding protein [Gammaproteobacteria bacterium]|nr:spermidine/putrescine ABC transporter substrate-binding protein [Gammaproteobacteria bacterium]MDH3412326.1 spermidine/putrescine ABC transporter substrate-binding protein [Gammaproteobacteria bacterium]